MPEDKRNPSYPKSPWDDCAHAWEEKVDSQFSNESEADVECVKCGCPGSQNRASGATYWPAT